MHLPPIVPVQPPNRRMMSASGREEVMHQDARGRQEHEAHERRGIDHEVEGSAIHRTSSNARKANTPPGHGGTFRAAKCGLQAANYLTRPSVPSPEKSSNS